MAINDDLSAYLADFGVSCTSGGTTATAILDQPSEVLAGDMVLSTDYLLTAKASDFGSLLSGDTITVNSQNYEVRETRLQDDGSFVEISLQKV
tara:strand:- start:147 stop:425 length:279 start_codon:yes stop_codon:yes gene_type:complete